MVSVFVLKSIADKLSLESCMLKISEIRGMSDSDLEGRIASSKQEWMKLREKYALRQLKDTSQLRQVRTDIARLLTVRRQRQIERFAQEAKA